MPALLVLLAWEKYFTSLIDRPFAWQCRVTFWTKASSNIACLSFSTPPNGKAHKRSIRRQEREGSPKCYHCDRDENITVEHFLVSCSKFEEIRSELLSQLRGELEAIGERGFQVWQRFSASSPACQSQIILGAQSFGALEDEAIDHFRTEYVARAWSERIVIWGHC